MMRYYSTIISICLALIFFASAQISCTKDPSVPSMDYSLSISVDTSSITRTSVILKGYSSNLSMSVWGFEQSVDNENWKVITDKIKLNSSGYCNDTVSSLKPGSLYYFRFYSKMEGVRKKYSQSLAIKTKELSSPVLSTVSRDRYIISSSILDPGGRPIWSVGFIISNSSDIDTIRRFGRRIEGVLEEDGISFYADIEGNEPGEYYYVTAFASNYDASSIHEGYSEPVLFPSTAIFVSSIELDQTSKELYIGEPFSLNATVFPSDAADKTIVWTTSDATVATVSQTGAVRAVGKGSCAIIASATSGVSVSCTCNVVGNPPVFEDDVFRSYIYSNFDKNNDGFLSREEVLLVTHINCSESAISSLSGIEYFPSVTYIDCHDNELKSLDVSSNPALQKLFCRNNQLTTLNVSNNPTLVHLDCYNNQLHILDVSNKPVLQYLDCSNNQLASLDVSNNPSLEMLVCKYNQLTSLTASNNPSLEYLECFDNQLTSLDVSNNPLLENLRCYNNQLTSLDVSNNPVLESLACGSNQLASLDVSNNPTLVHLGCYNNQLTSLNVSNNPTLVHLNCYNNQLTSLNVSNNPVLEDLSCGSNPLTSLDVSSNQYLKDLNCYNNQLTSLNVSSNLALRYLQCSSNQLTSLNVSSNPSLEELFCSYNQLTSLDVSSNPSLVYLYCDHNQLIYLDVSSNLALKSLGCAGNPSLSEIWLKTGQTIENMVYDSSVSTIYYK